MRVSDQLARSRLQGIGVEIHTVSQFLAVTTFFQPFALAVTSSGSTCLQFPLPHQGIFQYSIFSHGYLLRRLFDGQTRLMVQRRCSEGICLQRCQIHWPLAYQVRQTRRSPVYHPALAYIDTHSCYLGSSRI